MNRYPHKARSADIRDVLPDFLVSQARIQTRHGRDLSRHNQCMRAAGRGANRFTEWMARLDWPDLVGAGTMILERFVKAIARGVIAILIVAMLWQLAAMINGNAILMPALPAVFDR